jgi:GH43 family beta-xylosidase
VKISYLCAPVLLCIGIQLSQNNMPDAAHSLQKLPDTDAIVWDQSTLKRVSPAVTGQRYCGYARMLQLQDRSLIVIYEASGNIVCTKSNDLGNTWSEPVSIAAKADGVNMSVPDIVELKDHTLLACYNPRPSGNAISRRFGIRTKRSTDGGKIWKDERLVYEAGEKFENGCWEPAVIQLPDGTLELFFANEGPYTGSNEQNISMVRSADGGLNWTPEPTIASFRKNRRDGMPVPLMLNNGKDIVFSIEDNGGANFKPYIIKNSLSDNWHTTVGAKSEQRNYALKEHIADSLYAGAPFLRQMKTGQTILSYQGTEGRVNKMEFADMKVVLGDDHAANFDGKTTPFKIPADKHCLWNSLCVLDDNTIVALTSTNAFSDRTEVYMIKGKLRENRMLLADPTIFKDKGKYYLYGTSSNKGFEVHESDNLINWKKPESVHNGFALSKGESFGSKGFWAPQVFKYKTHYYMAYTANEEIAIAVSDSPAGPFRQKVLKPISGEGKQIDPFVFFDTDGKVYLYHVKLKNGNRIYVSEMKADLSDVVPGSSRECIYGDLPWENTEKTDWPVTEGPTVIKHKNLYYLIYSANDFRNKDYAVGYATAVSPLGPWIKYKGNPVISRASIGCNGTGHGDLFTDESANYKYVIHTHNSLSVVSPRATGIVNIRFRTEKGKPDALTADSLSFRFLMNADK